MRYLAIFVCQLALAGAAAAAPGDPDRSFGEDGVVVTPAFHQCGGFSDVAIAGSDRVIATGSENSCGRLSTPQRSVAAYLPSGALDPSFGDGDGRLSLGSGRGAGIAFQAPGKFIVLGDPPTEPSYASVVRLNPDGTLDTTFGDGGERRIEHAGAALAVDPEGRVVVAGLSQEGKFALHRLTPDGAIDQSFGAGGTASADFGTDTHGGVAVAVAVQPDGKLVAAGSVHKANEDRVWALARFTSEGVLDSGFGHAGTRTVEFGARGLDGEQSDAQDLVPLADGKLLVVGDTGRADWAFARLLPTGGLDPGFGSGGLVVHDKLGIPTDVELDPYGGYVVAGAAAPECDLYVVGCNGRLAVARFRDDGSFDRGFGAHGISPPVFPTSDTSGAGALTHDSLGRIVAVGSSNTDNFAVARFLDGPSDSTAPHVSLAVRRTSLKQLARKRTLRLRIRCSEDCTVTITGRLRRRGARPAARLAKLQRELPAGGATRLAVKVGPGRLPARDGRHRIGRLRAKISDTPGNTRTLHRAIVNPRSGA